MITSPSVIMQAENQISKCSKGLSIPECTVHLIDDSGGTVSLTVCWNVTCNFIIPLINCYQLSSYDDGLELLFILGAPHSSWNFCGYGDVCCG